MYFIYLIAILDKFQKYISKPLHIQSNQINQSINQSIKSKIQAAEKCESKMGSVVTM